MHKANLNGRLNYTISSSYRIKTAEQTAINSFGALVLHNWESQKNGIKSFKLNIRIHLEPKQKERCAYCRQYLQSSGKGEHLDHIVAKETRPQWMYVSKNLVLSCGGCNTPKNNTSVLNDPYSQETNNYPDVADAFKIFNPYYDHWGDHFLIDDEIFIQAQPNSKGDFTIKTCKLFREQVVINNTRELRMAKAKSYKKLTHKIYTVSQGTEEYDELQNALAQIIRTTLNK